VTHAVFAVHLYTYMLLIFCVSLAISGVDVLFGGTGLLSNWVDDLLSILNLAACAIYLHQASGTVYGAKGVGRAFQVAMLTVAVAAIALGYRFALLVITLYTT